MGFDPIYLIGCDTSYSIPDSVRVEDGSPLNLISTQDDDSNHFDPTYFGEGRRWHDPQAHKMLAQYAEVRSALEGHSVNIFNATVGGSLEVFPRVDYVDVF